MKKIVFFNFHPSSRTYSVCAAFFPLTKSSCENQKNDLYLRQF